MISEASLKMNLAKVEFYFDFCCSMQFKCSGTVDGKV